MSNLLSYNKRIFAGQKVALFLSGQKLNLEILAHPTDRVEISLFLL